MRQVQNQSGELQLPSIKSLTLKNVVYILVVYALFFSVSIMRIDPDFGWHLRAGEYISRIGIPRLDIFSYTASSFHWINHEWLNDRLVWHLHSLGGPVLLATVFAALWTSALLLASRQKALAMSIAALALLPYAGVRPIVWSVLFLALLLRIINAQNRKLMYVLPLLFLVWANLHGSFVIGLAVVVYYALVKRKKIFMILAPICALATLINPYGPQVYVEVLRTAADTSLKWKINEWHSLRILPASWLYIILIFSGFMLSEKNKLKQAGSLQALFFYAYLTSTRHFPLFVISSLEKFEEYLAQRPPIPRKLNGLKKALLAIIVTLILGIFVYGISTIFWPWQPRERAYPSTAIPVIERECREGNIFNHYNIGGYLIWKLPSHKFYIDGRMPSWRDENNKNFADRHLLIFGRRDYRAQEFKRYDIKCALVYKSDDEKHDFISGLKDEGWQDIWQDDTYILLKSPS